MMNLMIKKYLFLWGAIILPSFVALAEPSPTQQLSDQQLIQKRKSDKVLQYSSIPSSLDIHLLPTTYETRDIHFSSFFFYLSINHMQLLERDKLP